MQCDCGRCSGSMKARTKRVAGAVAVGLAVRCLWVGVLLAVPYAGVTPWG